MAISVEAGTETDLACQRDYLAPRCGGERSFAVAELATFYGRDTTVGRLTAPDAVRRRAHDGS